MLPSQCVQGLNTGRPRDVTATDCDVSNSQGIPKPTQPKLNKLDLRIYVHVDNHQNRLEICRKNSEKNILTQNDVSVDFDNSNSAN